MNIAVTSMGPSMDATFDVHFGRAPYFIIFDSETKEVVSEFNNEKNLKAVQGAGVESAKVMVDLDVKVVLTGHVGPKALDVLKLADISSYKVEAQLVKDAFAQYEKKNMSVIYEATSKGNES